MLQFFSKKISSVFPIPWGNIYNQFLVSFLSYFKHIKAYIFFFHKYHMNRTSLLFFPLSLYISCVVLNFSMYAAAAAKSLQSCPTLCDPIDGSPPGSPVLGILQARTLEWVAISFSNAGKWKVKVKSLSRVRLEQPHGLQPTRLLCPWDFPGKSTGVECHCLLLSTYSSAFF